jgi:hypothetical protein
MILVRLVCPVVPGSRSTHGGVVSPEEYELHRSKVVGDAETSPPFRKETDHD